MIYLTHTHTLPYLLIHNAGRSFHSLSGEMTALFVARVLHQSIRIQVYSQRCAPSCWNIHGTRVQRHPSYEGTAPLFVPKTRKASQFTMSFYLNFVSKWVNSSDDDESQWIVTHLFDPNPNPNPNSNPKPYLTLNLTLTLTFVALRFHHVTEWSSRLASSQTQFVLIVFCFLTSDKNTLCSVGNLRSCSNSCPKKH